VKTLERDVEVVKGTGSDGKKEKSKEVECFAQDNVLV
jgi:hypothetical protein